MTEALAATTASIARGRFWPLLALAAAAWVALALTMRSHVIPGFCFSAGFAVRAAGPAELAALLRFNPLPALAGAWLLMILAMMPPLLAEPVAHVWQRSFPVRRVRALALFALGYAAPWLLCGLALSLFGLWVQLGTGGDPLRAAAVGAGLALSWQGAATRQACLNRCHVLPPLAAFGLAADRDTLRYGAALGKYCVGSCWALMLLPLLAGPLHWPAMAAVALRLFAERIQRARAPATRWPCLAAGAAAIACAIAL